MPWPWKRDEPAEATSATPPDQATALPPSEAPLRNDDQESSPAVRIEVQDVYYITGIGCVAVGKVVAGSLTLPNNLRVEPGPGRRQGTVVLLAKSAMVHRQDVNRLETGADCGIVLRHVDPGYHDRMYVKSVLRKGDALVTT